MTRQGEESASASGRVRRADRYWQGQLLLAVLALGLAGVGLLASRQNLSGHALAYCLNAVRTLATPVVGVIPLIPPLLGGFSMILAGCSIGRQLLTTRRLMREIGPMHLVPSELEVLGQRLGLTGRLRLVTDPRPLAFCAGWVRPRVWLTTGLLTTLELDELTAVLRHERHHARHRDPLKLLLMRTLADAFFYVPVIRDLGRAYEVHKELAADAEAAFSAAAQVGLAGALLKLLAGRPSELDGAAVGPLLPGKSNGVTEARVDRLVHGGLPSLGLRRRSAVLSGLALLLFLAAGLWPVNRAAVTQAGGSCGLEETRPATMSLEELQSGFPSW